jgi:hypothetical protein
MRFAGDATVGELAQSRRASAARNDDVNESDDSTLAESRANKRAHIMVPMDDMSDNDDEEIAMLLQRDRAPIDEHVFVDEEE